MGLTPADGHLAYLSACSTAYSGTDLADEAIGLASAFQVAGFRHVIATLWPVRDDRAAGFSRAIYGRIANGGPPALAVHQAVREIRAVNPADPQAWASHVHFGA
jgi:CHAT domain-containing protein